MGRSDIVRLLLEAGADPSLRDNLGLTATDWAQRKGFIDVTQLLKNPHTAARRSGSSGTDTPKEVGAKYAQGGELPSETRTRAPGQDQRGFGPAAAAFLKARARPSISEPGLVHSQPPTEQSIPKTEFQEDPSPWSVDNVGTRAPDAALPTEPDTLRTRRETERIVEQARLRVEEEVRRKTQEQTRRVTPSEESRTTRQAGREATSLKRCPKCNTIYEDDGRTYCAYDAGRLVSVQSFDGSATSSFARPTLWALVAITLIGSVVVTYLATTYFKKEVNSPPPTVAAEKAPTAEDNSAVVGGALAGKQQNVPKAEYPANFKATGTLDPVTVVVRVNRNGRVISAQALNGPRQLRAAAEKAARTATFSADKLDGGERVAAGTITYSFRP